jgi:predicted O-methyltransferase YrrM
MYLSNHAKHLSPVLEELERKTYLQVLLPNMISGKEQGSFLYFFVSALNPQRVLELGTFTGYSAICMAMGMQKGSQLVTVDVNAELEYIVDEYIEKAGLSDIIHYKIIDAMEYIEGLEDDTLDLVFMDADKRNYPLYFQKLKPKVRKGGYILIDNVLWGGRVAQDSPNKDTLAILELNKMVFDDLDFISSILPLRDGLTIAKKIK